MYMYWTELLHKR